MGLFLLDLSVRRKEPPMDKTIPVPTSKTKVETVFAAELQMIADDDIRKFVITCFNELCPDYFWTCPCSTTGKYHPKISLGEGGLVRHTKLAVWWGLELLSALGYTLETTGSEPSEIVATLMLHDLIKNGKGLDTKGFPLERGVTGSHGYVLANRISYECLDVELDADTRARIFDGISGHMGCWTTRESARPQSRFAELIHLADYCASRKVDDITAVLESQKGATPNG